MTDETKKDPEIEKDAEGNPIVKQLTQEELDARMDQGPTRKQALMAKATSMGIEFSPNIGEDKLAERIAAREAELNPPEEGETQETAPEGSVQVIAAAGSRRAEGVIIAEDSGIEIQIGRRAKLPSMDELKLLTQDDIADLPKEKRTQIIRAIQRHENLRLIRCQIYNNNPAKNELKGEIVSVQNKYLGTVRKFIPFGDATKNGYHIPKILVDMLRGRQYQTMKSVKNPDGTERPESTLAPEFTIIEMAPLTKEELDKLAASQRARNASVGFIGA